MYAFPLQSTTDIKRHQWKSYQMWHTIQDTKVWLLLGFEFFKGVLEGGLTGFGPLVMSSLGFDSFKTLLTVLLSLVVSVGSMIV